jgi:hypothetical protein
MLEEKKVLGLLSPLFADHVRREADHFLMVEAMLENNMQTSGYTGTNSVIMPMEDEDIEEAIADMDVCEPVVQATTFTPSTTETLANNLAAEAKLAALKQKAVQPCTETAVVNVQYQQEPTFDNEVLEEIDDDEPIMTAASPVSTPKCASKLKYTWSSAWPRPLNEEK